LVLRTDNLLAGKLSSLSLGCLPLRCPAPLACGNYSGEAERGSGIGPKLFGFIPESRSRSPESPVDHQRCSLKYPFNPLVTVSKVVRQRFNWANAERLSAAVVLAADRMSARSRLTSAQPS
jgi:hypothetical protein